MKSKSQSQAEAGLSSMSIYLENISKNTTTGNYILATINASIDSVIDSFKTDFNETYNNLQLKSIKLVENINTTLTNFSDKFISFLEKFDNKNSINISENTSQIFNSKEKFWFFSKLENMENYLRIIARPKIQRENLKTNTDNHDTSENSLSISKQFVNYIKTFVYQIKSLNKVVTNSFNKRIDKLSENLDKLFNKTIDNTKINKTSELLNTFSDSIKKLSKTLWSVNTALIAFNAIFFVTLLIPLNTSFLKFLVGFGLFIGLFTRVVSDKDMPKHMIQFAVGLGILLVVIWGMQQLEFKPMLEMALFIGFLGLMLRGFGKASGNGLGLIGLSIGLFLLYFAISQYSKIKFSSLIKSLIFFKLLSWSLKGFGKFSKTETGPLALIGVAVGIAILTAAVYLFAQLPLNIILKVTATLLALGIASKLLGGPTRGALVNVEANVLTNNMFNRANSPILSAAFGIALLALALSAFGEIPLNNVIFVILTIVAISVAVKLSYQKTEDRIGPYKSKSTILSFALGLGILTLTLSAVGELDWKSPLILLGFIAGIVGLSIVYKKLAGNGRNNLGSLLLKISFSVAVMAVALWLVHKLNKDITLDEIIGFVSAVAILVAVYKLVGNSSGYIVKGSGAIALMSISIGILSLAFWFMNVTTKNISNDTLIGFAGGVVIMGAIFTLIGNVAGLVALGSVVSILMGVTIAVLSIAFLIMDKTTKNISNDTLIRFAGGVVIMGAIFAIIGIPYVAGLVALGSVVSILMGVTIAVLSIAFLIMDKTTKNISNDTLIRFAFAVVVSAAIFAIIGIPLVAGLVALGSVVAIVMAAAIGTLGFVIGYISNTNVNEQSIESFGKGLISILEYLTLSAIYVIPAAAAALALIPIYNSVYKGAKALKQISGLSVDEKNIEALTRGTDGVLKMLEKYSLNPLKNNSLPRAAVKAEALISVYKALYEGGKALQSVMSVQVDIPTMEAYVDSLSRLTDLMLISIASNVDKLKDAKPGIDALAKLISVGSGLSKAVIALSTMYYNEYEVDQYGQLKLKSVNRIKPNDLDAVTQKFGILIESLIKPLSIIGSEDEYLNFSGTVVANPFINKRTKKGIKTLADLANAFTPLIAVVKQYAELDISKSVTASALFNYTFLTLVETFITAFSKMAVLEDVELADPIKNINKFIKGVNSLKPNEFEQINISINKFIENLSDEQKWKRITKNFKSLNDDLKETAKTLNSIDIKKATLFEKTLQDLILQNNPEKLRQAVEALTDLFTLIQQNQESQVSTIDTNSTGNSNSVFGAMGSAFNSVMNGGGATQPLPEASMQTVAVNIDATAFANALISALSSKPIAVDIVDGEINSIK